MNTMAPGFSIWRDRDESSPPRRLLIGLVLVFLLLLEGFRILLVKLCEWLVIRPVLAVCKGMSHLWEPAGYCIGAWWNKGAREDAFWLSLLMSRKP